MFRKSIQHIIFASLVMSVAMPIVYAAPKNQRVIKSKKTSILTKIKNFWKELSFEEKAVGGLSALFGACFIAYVAHKNITIASEFKDAGECTICCDHGINMITPCCKRRDDGICRSCWNRPVQTGDYTVEGQTVHNKQRDACPFCREDKQLVDNFCVFV